MSDGNITGNAASSIFLSPSDTFWITVLVVALIALIILIIVLRWGPEYMRQEPRKRPNMLNFILILVLITAILLVTLTNNLTAQVTTLLGAIAGYIFGVTTDPRILKPPTGMDGIPSAKINVVKLASVAAGNSVTLDASDSTDPAGLKLTYKWEVSSKASSSQPDNPTAVRTDLTLDKEGSYEIKLTVNNGLQDSQPETVQITKEQDTLKMEKTGG